MAEHTITPDWYCGRSIRQDVAGEEMKPVHQLLSNAGNEICVAKMRVGHDTTQKNRKMIEIALKSFFLATCGSTVHTDIQRSRIDL